MFMINIHIDGLAQPVQLRFSSSAAASYAADRLLCWEGSEALSLTDDYGQAVDIAPAAGLLAVHSINVEAELEGQLVIAALQNAATQRVAPRGLIRPQAVQ